MLTSLQRALNLFAKRSKLETSHGVGVYVLAVPEGEAAVRTLNLEPELLIEGDTYVVSNDKKVRCAFPRSYRRGRM
jgi:hypothetical protein